MTTAASSPPAGPVGYPGLRAGVISGAAAMLAASGAAVVVLSGAIGSDRAPMAGPVLMTALALLPELAAITRRGPAYADLLVPGEAVLVFGLAFASPPVLITARLLATAGAEGLGRHRHPAKAALNMSLCTVETAVAIAVFDAVLGGRAPVSSAGVAAAIPAALAAFAVSALAMWSMSRLHGRPLGPRTASSLAVQAALATLGGIAAIAIGTLVV